MVYLVFSKDRKTQQSRVYSVLVGMLPLQDAWDVTLEQDSVAFWGGGNS